MMLEHWVPNVSAEIEKTGCLVALDVKMTLHLRYTKVYRQNKTFLYIQNENGTGRLPEYQMVYLNFYLQICPVYFKH